MISTGTHDSSLDDNAAPTRSDPFHFAHDGPERLAVLLEAAVHLLPTGQRRLVGFGGHLNGSLVGHMSEVTAGGLPRLGVHL
jgi:hypothetical protein